MINHVSEMELTVKKGKTNDKNVREGKNGTDAKLASKTNEDGDNQAGLLPMTWNPTGFTIIDEAATVLDDSELTPQEEELLKNCERLIKNGLTTFKEVGSAIYTIRERRLYRAKYSSFEKYLDSEWGIGRAHGYRLSKIGEAAKIVEDAGQTFAPKNASTAIAMSGLPKSEVLAVNAKANDAALKSKKPAQAAGKVVREAAKLREVMSKASENETKPKGAAQRDAHGDVKALEGAAKGGDQSLLKADLLDLKGVLIQCYKEVSKAYQMLDDGEDRALILEVIEALKERLESVGAVQQHIEATI